MNMRKRKRQTIAAMRAWVRAGKTPWWPVEWYAKRSPRRPPNSLALIGDIGRIESVSFVTTEAIA